MLDKLIGMISDTKKRGVAMMAGGMLSLLTGRKIVALGMFARGAYGLEREWRLRNPEFTGGWEERWQRAIDHYDATHQNPMNRKLHIIGIPIIVGGTAGLLLFRPFGPLWLGSAGAFAFGWALNFIGHGFYEKNAPAFADDPLSFVAGPVWDLRQVLGGRRSKNGETVYEAAQA